MTFKEVALSLNFKSYLGRPGVVIDARTKMEYPDDEFETKVLIYEDRVRNWFLRYGRGLQEDHDAGFIVLQVALAQIEGIEQYRIARVCVIICDEPVGRAQYPVGRPVIFFQFNHVENAEGLPELLYVIGVGSPERVDGLVLVADDGYVLVFRRQSE